MDKLIDSLEKKDTGKKLIEDYLIEEIDKIIDELSNHRDSLLIKLK